MKQLQYFLGLCGWLREYVPRYSDLTAPLTDLVGKKKFRWTPLTQQAIDRLKQELSKPLKLSRPHPDWPYVLHTDACSWGMRAVLYQTTPEGDKNIISYASAKFSPTESRYHSNEQECLVVVWAIKKYRPYLEDRPFKLRTDNKRLTWLKTAKENRDKLQRWVLLLQEFNPTI